MARQDSLAYDYYYSGGYAHSAVQKPVYKPNVTVKTKTQTKALPKKNTRVKAKSKASTLLMLFAVAFAAFFVLCRGVMITELSNNITQKKKALNDAICMNQKLQLEIDQSLDLKNIEKIATSKLQMRRPEKYQTIYINLNQVDYVEKIADNKLSLVKNVAGIFNNIKEYLD